MKKELHTYRASSYIHAADPIRPSPTGGFDPLVRRTIRTEYSNTLNRVQEKSTLRSLVDK